MISVHVENALIFVVGSEACELPITVGGRVQVVTDSCIAVGTLNGVDGPTKVVLSTRPGETGVFGLDAVDIASFVNDAIELDRIEVLVS